MAGELEARWNTALGQVAELEARLAGLKTPGSDLAPDERQRLLDLGRDVESLWKHPHAAVTLKKRILRTAVVEIILDVTGDPPKNRLRLHWAGGVPAELQFPRNGTGQHRRGADRQVLDLVRELAKVCDDQAIATTLNRLGYRTGQGNTWRSSRVMALRYYHDIAAGQRQENWLTLEDAALALQVSTTVVRRLIREKVLPAEQVVTYAPWVIRREDLHLPEVQAAVPAVQTGRQLPRTAPGQQELSFD